jgi:hypothetical protein
VSAYIEDRAHIDALVRFACGEGDLVWTQVGSEHRYLDPGDADMLGRTLWRENVVSVAYRYQDSAHDSLPGPIDFKESDATEYQFPTAEFHRPALSPVEVLKACDGLDYQSCEHPGWKTSEAKRFLDAIRDAAIKTLPGYEEATWDIRDSDTTPGVDENVYPIR